MAKEENDCQGVVDAVRKGASNAQVAGEGCAALMSLAFNNADNKKRIAEAGGIAMILSMLDVHGASNAEVAIQGCGALLNIAVNADNKKIALILCMLDMHGASNAGVAENGCGALYNLAVNNADNKSKIVAANGVSMVKRMKSTWSSNAGVQKQANEALCNLR